MHTCKHKVLSDGQQVTMVVRNNDQADIYWNCRFIDSTEYSGPADSNLIYKYRLVDVNFYGAILERRVVNTVEQGKEVKYKEFILLSFQQRERTRFVNATVLPEFVEY